MAELGVCEVWGGCFVVGGHFGVVAGVEGVVDVDVDGLFGEVEVGGKAGSKHGGEGKEEVDRDCLAIM